MIQSAATKSAMQVICTVSTEEPTMGWFTGTTLADASQIVIFEVLEAYEGLEKPEVFEIVEGLGWPETFEGRLKGLKWAK